MSELLIPGRMPSHDDELPFNRRFFVEQFHEGVAPACNVVADGAVPVVRLQLVNGDSLDIFCFEQFRKNYLVAQVFVDPGECDEFFQTCLPYAGIFRVDMYTHPTPDKRLGFKPTKPVIEEVEG